MFAHNELVVRLAGVRVELWQQSGTQGSACLADYDEFVIATHTNPNGYYCFRNVPAGEYAVRVILPFDPIGSVERIVALGEGETVEEDCPFDHAPMMYGLYLPMINQ